MSDKQRKTSGVTYVEVDDGRHDQRIDNFLLNHLRGVPRSYIYRILRRGEVRVNKGRVKARYRLQEGDSVRIPPVRLPEEKDITKPHEHVLQQLRESVLVDDKRLLALNKPAGIAVHGGSGLSYGVIEALRVLRPDDRQLELAHRLDRETSGCLLVVKKRSALRALHELLRTNQVNKRYIALLAGRWGQNRADVDAPLLKNTLQGGERVVRVNANGKQALTRFHVLERFPNATLVEAKPVTGRTHQIRVHAAHLGHPILGDDKYGEDKANRAVRDLGLRRLFLHAESLRFRWPDEQQEQYLKAPIATELQMVLTKLKSKYAKKL
ncbi:Ribosomal large subunit pseudouridine synthase C [hydrothermal vent metagenome]|uniref:Ribosomal large subunit pseudouridine synthase C n=1 Tax=hydrothermal vent metagenome TaxID=652676 RepID=A0A3B1BH11_9ZZZZ